MRTTMLLRTGILLPAAGWLFVITWLSITASPPSGPGTGPASTVINPQTAHLGMYGVLGALLMLAGWSISHAKRRFLFSAGIVVFAGAYGGLMELVQGTVPQRSASWEDALLNTVGAAIAVVAMEAVRSIMMRRVDRTRW